MSLIFNIWNFVILIIIGVAWYFAYKKYRQTKSRALLNSLPGIFTSLGLLGTFLTICSSLYDIKAGAEGTLDILSIIRQLIPAFTTSIIGLVGALIATYWAKLKSADEDHKDREMLGGTSPEEYIRDIAAYAKEMTSHKMLLSELNNHLATMLRQYKTDSAGETDFRCTLAESNKRQHEEACKLLNDIVGTHRKAIDENHAAYIRLNESVSQQSMILKEFIEGFVKRMDGIFTHMHDSIEQQVADFSELQLGKTSQILTSIAERLGDVSNGIIEGQRNTVETMLGQTNANVGQIKDAIVDTLDKMAEEMHASLSALQTQQAEQLDAIVAKYDSLAETLSAKNAEVATQATVQMHTALTMAKEQNADCIEQMDSLRKTVREASSELTASTLRMNEKAMTDLRDQMAEFVSDIQETVSEQCSTLGTAITTNVESLHEAYRYVDSLMAEIRQNYDQATIAYGNAVTVAHRTNESAEKAIATSNESLHAVEQTNRGISEMLDLLSKRQDNIEQLTKRIGSVSGAIVELQKLESVLNKMANGTDAWLQHTSENKNQGCAS